jgi:tetratricopeptide (TPR) repeat protein
MGLCYSRLNNIKAAETNFREVLNYLPYNRVALTALAIMYYNSKQYDEAIIFLNKVLDLNSSAVGIRELKNEIIFKSGKVEEFTREIKTQKKKNYGYRLYDEFIKSVPVEVYTDRYGTIDEKITKLNENEEGRDSLISLSLCHLFKGDTDRAIDYLMEARKRFLI